MYCLMFSYLLLLLQNYNYYQIFSVFVDVKQNMLAVLPLSHQHAEVRSFLHRARQRMNWPLERCRRCSFRWKWILQVWDWAAGSHPWARCAEIEADGLGMGVFLRFEAFGIFNRRFWCCFSGRVRMFSPTV